MSERIDQDPFKAPLEHVSVGSVSEFQQFPDDDRYIVRVTPHIYPSEYAKFDETLKQIERNSDIKVPPHFTVYGNSHNPSLEVVDRSIVDDEGFYPALFIVTKRVYGQDFLDASGRPDQTIHPERAEKMLTGITDSVIHAYEERLPYSYEIRPGQIRYGCTDEDTKAYIQMIDLDYANISSLPFGEVVEILDHNIKFLQDYPLHQNLRAVAKSILAFFQSSDAKQYRQQSIDHKDVVDNMVDTLLDYLDALDHDL